MAEFNDYSDPGGGSGPGLISRAIEGKMADKKAAKSQQAQADAGSYKRGGKVRKTGLARVHKGERVLTKKQAKRFGGRKS